MRCDGSQTGRQGFTLVELIAIIVLLVIGAGLLVPVMARGSSQATLSRCMNNVRELALAAQLYSEDNNDLWPANGNSDVNLNVANPPAKYVPRIWVEGREPSNVPSKEAADGMISERVSLLASYVRDKQVFRCPDDPLMHAGGSSFPRPRSYGLNIFVGWTPDRLTGATWYGEPNSRGQIFRKTAEMPKPGEIFLFGEIHPFSICHPPFGTHPTWDAAGNPTGLNRSFNVPGNNHGAVSIFAMADGHSEVRRWRNPRFNNPWEGGRPASEANPFWHTHDTALPGVTTTAARADFTWLSLRATVPK